MALGKPASLKKSGVLYNVMGLMILMTLLEMQLYEDGLCGELRAAVHSAHSCGFATIQGLRRGKLISCRHMKRGFRGNITHAIDQNKALPSWGS